jgi:hypothetical protein
MYWPMNTEVDNRTVTVPARLRPEIGMLLLLCLSWGLTSARAHEAWIEPSSFSYDTGDTLSAHLRVGQMFRGNSLLYNRDKFERLQLVAGNRQEDIKGRLGDLPAIRHPVRHPGLQNLVFVSTGNRIHYETREKFANFARKEGVEWILEEHRRRGFPDQDFSETYFRYAKSLITVGNSKGNDRPMGLRLEIILLDNPYTPQRNRIRAQVLWQGEPYGNAQLTIFRKPPDGDTIRETVRTGEDGIGLVPLEPGQRYLLNAVYAVPADKKKKLAPVWYTHWASITFASG